MPGTVTATASAEQFTPRAYCQPDFNNCLFENNVAKTGPRSQAGGRGFGNVNVTNNVRVSGGHIEYMCTPLKSCYRRRRSVFLAALSRPNFY